MKLNQLRFSVILSLLTLFICTSLLSSCSSSRPHSAWMDVQHARELDHKKGNRSKHLQKNYAKAQHY